MPQFDLNLLIYLFYLLMGVPTMDFYHTEVLFENIVRDYNLL